MNFAMTQNQFNKLHEIFALYADKWTTYRTTRPFSNGKKVEGTAMFIGVGVGVNEGRVILSSCGHRMAIPFTDVKLPKLSWE